MDVCREQNSWSCLETDLAIRSPGTSGVETCLSTACGIFGFCKALLRWCLNDVIKRGCSYILWIKSSIVHITAWFTLSGAKATCANQSKATEHNLLNSNVVFVALPVLISHRFFLLKTLNFKGATWLELGFLLLSFQKVKVWAVVVLPTELAYSLQHWLQLGQC